MSDEVEVLCGACGELIPGELITIFQCSQCRNDLHDPETCSDVWALEDGFNFCNKGCANKWRRARDAGSSSHQLPAAQQMPAAMPAAKLLAAAPTLAPAVPARSSAVVAEPVALCPTQADCSCENKKADLPAAPAAAAVDSNYDTAQAMSTRASACAPQPQPQPQPRKKMLCMCRQ